MPRFLKSMPNTIVAAACRMNSTPPVTSSWLIGAAIEHRADDELMQQHAGERDQHDAEQRGGRNGVPPL